MSDPPALPLHLGTLRPKQARKLGRCDSYLQNLNAIASKNKHFQTENLQDDAKATYNYDTQQYEEISVNL